MTLFDEMVTIKLQPEGANMADFLLIKSTAYWDALTYKVNESTTDHIVDSSHVIIGKHAVSILDSSPTQLLFENGLTGDVIIDIILGRDTGMMFPANLSN